MISDFEDLLNMAHAMDEPQRLLLLLAKTEPQPGNGGETQTGTLTPVICVDKSPEELQDFQSLVAEADQVTPHWDLVLITSLSGSGGSPPTSEQAEPHLDKMTHDVLNGQDLSRYVVFDRNENPVFIQPRDGVWTV